MEGTQQRRLGWDDLGEVETVARCANYLGVHANLLYRLIQEGKLRAIRIGGSIRVRKEDLLDLMEPAARAAS